MIDRTIAIVGLGLIGASLGLALRGAGRTVVGFDRDPSAAELALGLGCVDRTSADLRGAIADADAIVLATPVGATLGLIEPVDVHRRPSSLVIDTGSAKESVVRRMGGVAGGASMLGGHPIAGREVSGAAGAEEDMFVGHTFVLCPHSSTSREALERAEALARVVGAVPVVLDAREHDRALARTSHLPQVLSSALALSAGGEPVDLVGPGLRGMLRLAGSDPVLWKDTLIANRGHVGAAIDDMTRTLVALREALEHEDADALLTFLEGGREAKAVLMADAA